MHTLVEIARSTAPKCSREWNNATEQIKKSDTRLDIYQCIFHIVILPQNSVVLYQFYLF